MSGLRGSRASKAGSNGRLAVAPPNTVPEHPACWRAPHEGQILDRTTGCTKATLGASRKVLSVAQQVSPRAGIV